MNYEWNTVLHYAYMCLNDLQKFIIYTNMRYKYIQPTKKGKILIEKLAKSRQPEFKCMYT